MIGIFRPPAKTGPFRQPEPPALGLLLGHREALLSPAPFHSLVVHTPAFLLKQRRDASIPIASILPGKGNDSIPQGFFISHLSRPIRLRGAPWSHHVTRPAFGHRERP